MDRILIAESNTELASQLKLVFADVNNYPMSCDTIIVSINMIFSQCSVLLDLGPVPQEVVGLPHLFTIISAL